MDRDDGRNETAAERADRNWTDLLQEMRVSQTGTQVLAGFLMTLPFTQRFADLDPFQKGWYLGLVGLAVLCVGLMLAPVAMHRHFFRQRAKDRLVVVGHAVMSVALVCVALLMAGIVFLIFDVVMGHPAGIVAGCVAASVLATLLMVLPRSTIRPG